MTGFILLPVCGAVGSKRSYNQDPAVPRFNDPGCGPGLVTCRSTFQSAPGFTATGGTFFAARAPVNTVAGTVSGRFALLLDFRAAFSEQDGVRNSTRASLSSRICRSRPASLPHAPLVRHMESSGPQLHRRSPVRRFRGSGPMPARIGSGKRPSTRAPALRPELAAVGCTRSPSRPLADKVPSLFRPLRVKAFPNTTLPKR